MIEIPKRPENENKAGVSIELGFLCDRGSQDAVQKIERESVINGCDGNHLKCIFLHPAYNVCRVFYFCRYDRTGIKRMV